MYKSGDLARYLPDGNLEFLGRSDLQAKIHGFRIELGEIEAALGQHPAVYDRIVVARQDQPGHKRLVAYVVRHRSQTLTAVEARQFLRQRLPEYMMPSAFVFLEALPLTSHGKVDLRALPAPDRLAYEVEGSFLPPRTHLEETLAGIWAKVLGVDRVGVKSDFFELGGDSLLAVSLFAQIQSVLGRKLPLASLLQHATIERQAELFPTTDETTADSALVPIQPLGGKIPFFCIHGIGGEVITYTDLARHLGTDQPLYGLQLPELDEGSFPALEELAAEYVRLIRDVQPVGPYLIGGFSSGGTIAFEMAQQLRSAGDVVGLVAIFDQLSPTAMSHAPSWGPRTILRVIRNVPYWLWDDVLRSSPKRILTRAIGKLRVLGARVNAAFGASGKSAKPDIRDVLGLQSFPDAWRELLERHHRAVVEYRPKVYPGQVTVFSARGRALMWTVESDLGWRALAAEGVRVEIVPGSHENLMHAPFVQAFASVLQKYLDTASKSQSFRDKSLPGQ